MSAQTGTTYYSRIYYEVEPKDGDIPKDKGWYEKDASGKYVLSTDDHVDHTKTYYTPN